MRNLTIQFPSTNGLTDSATQEYARLLNIELDNLTRDLNRYVSRVVHADITGDITLTADDEVVLVSGTVTITLPAASSTPGKVFNIKNTGTDTVTVETDGTETIDCANNWVLAGSESITIVSDGSNWWVI